MAAYQSPKLLVGVQIPGGMPYNATVMKLVYMTDLKSVAARHGGSSPPSRTKTPVTLYRYKSG